MQFFWIGGVLVSSGFSRGDAFLHRPDSLTRAKSRDGMPTFPEEYATSLARKLHQSSSVTDNHRANMSEPARFQQYEKVRVRSTDPAKKIDGQEAVVLGLAEKDSGGWYYSAFVESDRCCWCFEEDELISLGQFTQESDFYDGSSLRVVVDENGRGADVEYREPQGSDPGEPTG